MQLKEFQVEVLEKLSNYLRVLSDHRSQAEEIQEFQLAKGRNAKLGDYCREAWTTLLSTKELPLLTEKNGSVVVPPYIARQDVMNRSVPNICLKLPTGGGKTFLGTAAVERINSEYFKKQTGLVLWVVPSDAIYRQTWKAFANREHPYRQTLERASGGRVRLLEKGDSFTKLDVDQFLCVMLLMLQAGAVRQQSKDARKMFQDSGRYPTFFPQVDDKVANEQLLKKVPKLDVFDLSDEGFRFEGPTPKHSLGNVLRIVRPLVVIDEGHKAYSDTALETIASYNPRFLLELSATPNSGKSYVSNVLVNVTGAALRNEQMIKLPINLINESRADWKHALSVTKDKRDELQRDAVRVQRNEGRYIRPIALVRVERTGKDQRDRSHIHSEDVRDYLIEKLGVNPDQIKVKSAELDELDKIDLLSDTCPVRYIITKDALREGWDCPFAYVLTVLSKTTADTALTQMIGRVLRQPETKFTTVASLNECYVFTIDQEVQAAVQSVRRGLEEEGMGDLAANVRVSSAGASQAGKLKSVKRRKAFAGTRIFMPRILSRHAVTNEWRQFDYDRDLLSGLEWEKFSFSNRKRFTPDEKNSVERTLVRVSVEDLGNVDDDALPSTLTIEEEPPTDLDAPAMVRMLLDVIPNPWQGTRILNETLAELRKRGVSEQRIIANRLFLAKAMRDDLKRQVNLAAEKRFRSLLSRGGLFFRLEASDDPDLNWELAKSLELEIGEDDKPLLRKNGKPLERSLFSPIYQKQLNGLEKNLAWYLDSESAIRWWHRISVKQDWYLQGWQRNRVYPDFLVCLLAKADGKIRFTVLETKGLHLAGNEETEYKQRLFDLLTKQSQKALTAGELKLGVRQQQLRFEILLEADWQQSIPKLLS